MLSPLSPESLRSFAARGATALGNAASKGKESLKTLSQAVSEDGRANNHSALQSSAFSILDVTSTGSDSSGILERVEREEESLATSTATSAASASAQSSVASRNQGVLPRIRSFCHRFRLRLLRRCVTFTLAPAAWLFLIILGVILACFVVTLIEFPVSSLLGVRGRMIASLSSSSPFFSYCGWVSWCVLFTCLSGLVSHLIPASEGSGIPQVKAILAGTPNLSHFISPLNSLAKSVGLVFAQGAGLSVGREGPFVSIACALASGLSRLPYFSSSPIAKNEAMFRQILAAAVAAGVTAVFGTPIGGVLFAMEVTSTFFFTAALGKSFLTAVVCRLLYDVLLALRGEKGFLNLEGTASISSSFASIGGGGVLDAQLIAFAVLGAFCGLFASLFVYALNKIHILRSILLGGGERALIWRRYAFLITVAVIVSNLTYLMEATQATDRQVIVSLFSSTQQQQQQATASPSGGAASEPPHSLQWASPLATLPLFLVIKFAATLLSLSLPIACGLFIPLFVMGGALGRFFGELLYLILPASASISPNAYALVGAAALTSGATQTVSCAILVFELTGSITLLLPVLLAVLISTSVSSLFTISVYDVLLILSGLPYLPRLHSYSKYKELQVADVMRAYSSSSSSSSKTTHKAVEKSRARVPLLPLLTLSSTYGDALTMLRSYEEQRAASKKGVMGFSCPRLPRATPLSSSPTTATAAATASSDADEVSSPFVTSSSDVILVNSLRDMHLVGLVRMESLYAALGSSIARSPTASTGESSSTMGGRLLSSLFQFFFSPLDDERHRILNHDYAASFLSQSLSFSQNRDQLATMKSPPLSSNTATGKASSAMTSTSSQVLPPQAAPEVMPPPSSKLYNPFAASLSPPPPLLPPSSQTIRAQTPLPQRGNAALGDAKQVSVVVSEAPILPKNAAGMDNDEDTDEDTEEDEGEEVDERDERPLLQPAQLNNTAASERGGEVIKVDHSPFTVDARLNLAKAHFLFAMCLYQSVVVTRGDILCGVVFIEDLNSTTKKERVAATSGNLLQVLGTHPP